MDHPNIVKFYEVYEDKKNFHLVMEYCSGGDLEKYMVEKPFLEEDLARYILKQLLKSVIYLHK